MSVEYKSYSFRHGNDNPPSYYQIILDLPPFKVYKFINEFGEHKDLYELSEKLYVEFLKRKITTIGKKELRNLSKNAIISEEEFEQLDNIIKGHYISVDEVSVNYLKSLIEKNLYIDLNDLDSTDYSSPLKVLNKIEQFDNALKELKTKVKKENNILSEEWKTVRKHKEYTKYSQTDFNKKVIDEQESKIKIYFNLSKKLNAQIQSRNNYEKTFLKYSDIYVEIMHRTEYCKDQLRKREEISWLKKSLNNSKVYFPSYLYPQTEKEIDGLYENYSSKKFKEIERMIGTIRTDSSIINNFIKSNSSKFLIIEGMAGTGKTEAINFLLSEIFSKEDYLSRLGRTFNQVLRDKYEVVVCAPSNVAVANIRQRNIFFAKTFQNVSNQIKNKSPKYKNLKYLIVDEANMLTSPQIKNLVKYLKEYKEINFDKLKFVFIGDEGQILPFHHSAGVNEYSSYGLDSNFLKNLLRKERQVVATGLTLSLSFDHRFKLNNLPENYIESVKWLRTEPEDDVITEFLERNNQNEVVETIKEENIVINIFNREVSLGTEIRETLQNDEKPNFDKIKARYDQALQGITEEDFFLACNLYKDQKNRRPELGKLYSLIFPKIEERINNKSQLNQVIILHRSNEQVTETNLGIRSHLFPEVDSKKIEETLILRGDILIIESSQFDEDQDSDNQVYPGESVVVLDADTVDIKEHRIETYGNFWKLTVRPIFRLQDRQLDVFKQKIPFLSKKNKEIIVWDGYLTSSLENKKIYAKYISDLKKVEEDGLVTKDSKEQKIFKSYAVKYGYAKTNYAAQGGEWESVILQVSDSDWKGKYSNARWLYTAVSRSTKKLFFVNS